MSTPPCYSNTTAMQYETKTHTIHRDKHKWTSNGSSSIRSYHDLTHSVWICLWVCVIVAVSDVMIQRTRWIQSPAFVSRFPTVRLTTATMATALLSPTHFSVTVTTAGTRRTVTWLDQSQANRLVVTILMFTLQPSSFPLFSEFFCSVS